MKALLLVNDRRGSRSLNLSSPWIIASFILAFTLAISAISYISFMAGKSGQSEIRQTGSVDWQHFIQDSQEDIARLSEKANDDLNALALRLGQVEARLTRLDALGGRLADMAELDQGEFNFVDLPAQGGPAVEDQVNGDMSDFMLRFDDLQNKITEREKQLLILESLLINKELSKQVLPNGKPVTKGWISSRFGKRLDPFTGKKSQHHGVDFAGKYGSDIVSVASGVVVWSGKKQGYGNMVEINHGNGYVTRYAHNSKNLVQSGDRIEKGQTIAKMGSSGRSTGPHVHFEVLHNGKVVNPAKYIIASK
jgi:murein DD-endopeptidase MepM/ murein hydrolase activator NlpD